MSKISDDILRRKLLASRDLGMALHAINTAEDLIYDARDYSGSYAFIKERADLILELVFELRTEIKKSLDMYGVSE